MRRKKKKPQTVVPQFVRNDIVVFNPNSSDFIELQGQIASVDIKDGAVFYTIIGKFGTVFEVKEQKVKRMVGSSAYPFKEVLTQMLEQKEFDISCVKLHLSKQLFLDLALEFKEFHHKKALANEPPLRDELVDLFDHFFDDAITLSKIRP